MIIIYKYTNKINDKVYIGQTCQTLKERAGNNGYRYRHCLHFYSAICKYGWNSFIPEILEYVEDQALADEREIYYIKLYDSISSGYNIDEGGHIEKKRSEETKRKISKAVSSNKNSRAKEVIVNDIPTGYTIGEYARLLGISQSTLKKWCNKNQNGYSYRKFSK